MRQSFNTILAATLLAILTATTVWANNPYKSAERGFIENKGQFVNQSGNSNSAALYVYPTRKGMNVQVREDGLSFDTYQARDEADFRTFKTHRLDLQFLGCRTSIPQGSDPLAGKVNIATVANDITSYNQIKYKGLYPGIDFVLSIDEKGSFKYDFHAEQAIDAEQIKLAYTGFDEFRIDGNKLVFILSGKELIEEIPASWKTKTGEAVEVNYHIISKTDNRVVIGLDIPESIQPETALVIDPVVRIEWGTYYGDELEDVGNGIATDSLGNIFACGTTHSINSFASEGSFQSEFSGGNTDAYLVKFNQHGLRHWATYYGGTGDDEGLDVDVDSYENVFLVGKTNSVDSIGTHGIHQTGSGGGTDGFVAKFNRFGEILWDTYIGGAGEDQATSCHANLDGTVAVIGHTDTDGFLSNDSVNPTTPYQAGIESYLAVFNLEGALLKSRYVGGEGDDFLQGVEQDSLKSLILVGNTNSSQSISQGNSLQAQLAGDQDAFIMKIDSNNAVVWSTYFGGDSLDAATGVESVGDTLYISGYTGSSFSYPDTLGSQDTLGGNLDAFVLSLMPEGNVFWFTYLGAENDDMALGISRDYAGNIYVTGTTTSDSIMGTEESYANYSFGEKDVFVTKFNTIGEKKWGTYYGGPEDDFGNDIAVYGFTSVYVTGSTQSMFELSDENDEFHIHQETNSDDMNDAFMARFTQTISTPCTGIGSGGGGGSGSGGGYGGSGGSGGGSGPPPLGICVGDSILLSTHGGALGNGAQWVWYKDECGETDLFIGEGPEIWVSPDTTTWYFVRAESVDCISSCASAKVHVDYPNTVTAWAQDSICPGTTLNLFAEGGYSYVWTAPNDTIYLDQNPSIDSVGVEMEGTYQVIGFTQFGCSDTTEIEVDLLPSPVFTGNVIHAKCPGEANGSIALNVPVDTLANDSLQIVWMMNGSSELAQDSLTAGLYIVQGTNSYGCSLTQSFTVEEPILSIDSTETAGAWCDQPNGGAEVYVTSSDSYQVLWLPTNVVGDSVGVLTPGMHQAMVTTSNGCMDSTTVFIPNLGQFTAVIDPDSLVLPYLATEEISAYTIPEMENSSFEWTPADWVSCSDCEYTILDPDSTTWFQVTITSEMGCTSTDSVQVVRELPIPTVFVPTVFSPNGDGLNDELCVLGVRIISFELKIFNNAGKEVFTTSDPEKCWNGKLDGVMQTGSFIYTITAVMEEGMQHSETGTLTIRR